MVVEATGGYERPVSAALAAAGLPRPEGTRVGNPRQARGFAKSTGKLAKTDALDTQGWRTSPRRTQRVPGRRRARSRAPAPGWWRC